jgi:hypothetical protein
MKNEEQIYLIMNKIQSKDLKEGFSIFGGKGAVWIDNCHISEIGNNSTLCGMPMLNFNYAINEKEIGCIACIKKYKEITNG